MRGKGKMAVQVNRETRITPAYAGKSQAKQCSGMAQWDHPRLCGEKSTFFSSSSINLGSPPPMRGKAMKLMLWQKAFRITPAYAGKRILLQQAT